MTGEGSSIGLSHCSHVSLTSVLQPFVGLAIRPAFRDSPALFVRGTSLLLRDMSLVLGTGPLFSFDFSPDLDTRLPQPSSCIFDTLLISSHLVNMSSPGNPSGHTTSRNTNGQQIIGCVVSHCTNHQDGTAMLNPNSPGHFICVNSSFSHCSTETTSDDAPTDQAFTQGDRIENPNTFPIMFTRCTFSHMNSTSNGAAIYIFNCKSLFSINGCHFYRCISTNKWGGGAVRHFADTDWISDFVMTDSSFLECNASCGANAAGGSLAVSMKHGCTITSSIFRSSHATGRGGGCFFNRCGVNITNCVFERCVTGQNGGAISMNELWSLCCKNTAFRGCWYTGAFQGSRDVAIDVWTNQKIGKANFPGVRVNIRVTECDLRLVLHHNLTLDPPNLQNNTDDTRGVRTAGCGRC